MNKGIYVKEDTDYQLSTSVRDGILELVISGDLTKNTLDKLHAEVITMLKGIKAKAILTDVRGLKGPTEISAAYFRARDIPTDVKKLPSAVVDQPDNKEYKSFYETTAANAGQVMKFFTDIEAARAWLKSKL